MRQTGITRFRIAARPVSDPGVRGARARVRFEPDSSASEADDEADDDDDSRTPSPDFRGGCRNKSKAGPLMLSPNSVSVRA
jgi:hypothetical protein